MTATPQRTSMQSYWGLPSSYNQVFEIQSTIILITAYHILCFKIPNNLIKLGPLKENKRDADGSASKIACFPAYPQSQPTRPQNSLAAKNHSWLPSDRCERFRVILVGQFQNSSHPPSTPPSSIISLGNSLTLTRASVQFCVSWRPIIRWVKCIYTGKSGRSV